MHKNLKILHLTTANQTRGIADYTRDMIHALKHYGFHQEIYPLEPVQNFKKNLTHCSKKAQASDLIHIQHEFSFFNKHNLKQSINTFQKFLQQFIQIKKPVVVTFHTEAHFFDAKLYNCLKKNFFKQLSNYYLKYLWYKKISALFNRHNNFHAIVHTQQTKLKLAQSGIPAEKIAVMPVGIPARTSLTQTPSQTAKQLLNYPKPIILLSIFGFITENKGHEFAIKALELLPKHYHLAIIGGPHPEEKQSNMEKILALSRSTTEFKERIRMTGYVDPKTADLYYAATDICLAPYHGNMSGSGAIGWALSSGKPIIASKTATFTEINQNAHCLFMCEEKSISDLAQKIEYLISNPNLQIELTKNALNYAANHQWPAVVKKIITCYEKCLGAVDINAYGASCF